MVVKATPFWTRVAESLRLKTRETKQEKPKMPEATDDALLTQPMDLPEPIAETPDRPGPLARWTRRDQAIVQLQEGYEKVTRVIEEIQKHMAQQGDRSERICTALEHLARAMSDTPAIARQQAQTLDVIAAQLEASNARTQLLADAIHEIPKATRGQSETLSGINKQLEVSNEQAVMAAQTMDRLGTNIRTLGDSTLAQGEILREMNAKAAEQNQQLTLLIANQSRRFLMLFVVTVVMAVAAIATGLIGLTLRP